LLEPEDVQLALLGVPVCPEPLEDGAAVLDGAGLDVDLRLVVGDELAVQVEVAGIRRGHGGPPSLGYRRMRGSGWVMSSSSSPGRTRATSPQIVHLSAASAVPQSCAYCTSRRVRSPYRKPAANASPAPTRSATTSSG